MESKNFLILTAAGVYSLAHLLYVLVFVCLTIVGLFLLSKKKNRNIKIFNFVIAIMVTVAELFKIGFTHYYHYDVFSVLSRWIPLSFCSLLIYSSWLSICKNNFLHKLGSVFLSSGCLIAGLAFLIYPSTAIGDWAWNHFYSIHGMTYHYLMFFTGLINLIWGVEKPTLKNFKYYLCFILFFLTIAIVIYYTTGESFMFVGCPYALPQIVQDIYNFSHIIYTIGVVFAYSIIYFVSTIIYLLFIKKEDK